MVRFALLAVALVLVAGAPDVRGQDSDEVKRLKKEIESLQAKLKDANLKIEKLEVQLKSTGGKKPADKAPKADPFAVGTVFTGTRTFSGGYRQTVVLEVTKREGYMFECQITLANDVDKSKRVVGAKGMAGQENGAIVRFTTEKVGKFQHKFTGKYNNGGVGFDVTGTNNTGQPIKASGSMSSK
jgi:hypothetical protein